MTNTYQKKYDEYAKKFWELQQLDQTEEEKQYDDLCHKLEEMITTFRQEINELEKTNQELQEKVENVAEVKKQYEELKARENQLLRLKSEMGIP